MKIQQYKLFLIFGLLAFFFPIVLFVGDLIFLNNIQPKNSLSKYYHSEQSLFFGFFVVCSSILLLKINSFSKKGNQISKIAGMFLFLAFLFPTPADKTPILTENITFWRISEIIHISSGSLFFCLITFLTFSFLENKVIMQKPNIKKQPYKPMAILMLICIIFIGLDYFFHQKLPEVLSDIPLKLIFETLWCWTLGLAWVHFYSNLKKLSNAEV